VKTLNCSIWRHSDGADEELRAVLDRYFDQLVELAVCVIVVCLACGATDLGEGKVDTEREGFIGQMRFEFVDYLEVYE
jgi:hypothetical protein